MKRWKSILVIPAALIGALVVGGLELAALIGFLNLFPPPYISKDTFDLIFGIAILVGLVVGLVAAARYQWNDYQWECYSRRLRLHPHGDNDEFRAFADREEARYKRRII
jgi:hypothetical protein